MWTQARFSLEELANSDVFNVKCDWSDNIRSLRQLAVQKPHIISETFIFQHFTVLRLVDRNINEVDRGLLKFTNLTELSLTGNSLTSVVGSHLPRSLTVLQLFANKFTDLKDLTVNPPPNLQHLGVGYNHLTDVSSYICPYYWPNLLSLDLSYNKIGRVKPTLEALSGLVTLRNLSLMANPITLAPGYTGCTLDMLPHLGILDDVSISDDDRLHFTHISREPVEWDQAIFCVTFPTLENLRQPPPNEAIDEANFLYPVQKKFAYLIRFQFVSDSFAEESSINLDKESVANIVVQEPSSKEITATPSPVTPLTAASKELDDLFTQESEGSRTGAVFETEALLWEENLQFSKPVIIRCCDLPLLQQFVSSELQFTVVEKVVDSFTTVSPPDPTTPTSIPPSASKKKGGKDDKKKKKDDASKEKVLKDKEGNVLKWVDSAPTFSEIAYIKANMNDLLQNTVTTGKRECIVTEKPPTATPMPEDGRQSSCSAKGGAKGKKGGGKKKAPVTPVPVTPPEPLRMEYKVERVKWSSIEECREWNKEAAELDVLVVQPSG